jgi:hypothetical protein
MEPSFGQADLNSEQLPSFSVTWKSCTKDWGRFWLLNRSVRQQSHRESFVIVQHEPRILPALLEVKTWKGFRLKCSHKRMPDVFFSDAKLDPFTPF